MINVLISRLSALLGFPDKGFRKYLKNTMWMLAERGFSIFMGLAVGIAVARHLGPENYGVISYGYILYAVAMYFLSLGFDDLVIREGIKNPEKTGIIFGSALACRVGAAAAGFAACSVFAYFTTDKTTFLPVLIIVSCIILQPINILSVFFQMNVKSRFPALANMWSYGISGIAKIILILVDAPLYFFALAVLLEAAVAMTALVIFYFRGGFSFKSWGFEWSWVKYFFQTGWPLTIMVLLGALYSKIDMVMVKNMLGDDALGKYSVAVKLTEVWYYFPVAVAGSLFPAFIHSKENDNEYQSRLMKITYAAAAGSAGFALIVTFISPFVINILYGEAYAEAAGVLSIFIWCLVFYSFHAVTIKWIMAENYILLGLYRTAAGLAVNLFLNYIFIKRWGIMGAAWATLAAYAFFSYFIDLFSSKTRPLFIIKTKGIFFPFIYLINLLKKRFFKY